MSGLYFKCWPTDDVKRHTTTIRIGQKNQVFSLSLSLSLNIFFLFLSSISLARSHPPDSERIGAVSALENRFGRGLGLG